MAPGTWAGLLGWPFRLTLWSVEALRAVAGVMGLPRALRPADEAPLTGVENGTSQQTSGKKLLRELDDRGCQQQQGKQR